MKIIFLVLLFASFSICSATDLAKVNSFIEQVETA